MKHILFASVQITLIHVVRASDSHGAGYGSAYFAKLPLCHQFRAGIGTVLIAERAKTAIGAKTVYAIRQPVGPPPVTTRMANITVVYPKDAAFPPSFLAQDWTGYKQQWMLPRCVTADAKCDAALIDLDGDGTEEVLLFTSPVGQSAAFALQRDRTWAYLGSLPNSNCADFRDALRPSPPCHQPSRISRPVGTEFEFKRTPPAHRSPQIRGSERSP